MQYSKLIAEQKHKLEQLKMQGEYEEVSAQENVYETLTDDAIFVLALSGWLEVLESCLSVTLPTEKHDIMTTFLGETDNASLIPKEQRTYDSQASQEEPRLEYPTPEAQIHSPYQPTEDRPALLSEVDNLSMKDAENTQVYRTTEGLIIHTAQFQTQQQQATPNNIYTPVSFSDNLHNQQNIRTLEAPFHDTPRQDVSTQIADALVRITQQ